MTVVGARSSDRAATPERPGANVTIAILGDTVLAAGRHSAATTCRGCGCSLTLSEEELSSAPGPDLTCCPCHDHLPPRSRR